MGRSSGAVGSVSVSLSSFFVLWRCFVWVGWVGGGHEVLVGVWGGVKGNGRGGVGSSVPSPWATGSCASTIALVTLVSVSCSRSMSI